MRARWLPLLALLAGGCASVVRVTTPEGKAEDVSSEELQKHQHCSLRLCILEALKDDTGLFQVQGTVQRGKIADLQQTFPQVRVQPELDGGKNCDVGLKYADDWNVDVYSAYSPDLQLHLQAPWAEPTKGRLLCRWLKTTEAGKALQAQAAAQRERLAAAMTPPSGPRPDKTASAPEPAGVDVPTYKTAEDPHRFALVVGIEKYSDLPDAQFAERDAAAIKSHLLALGFPERNVVLLSGAKAGRASLAKYIEDWLPRMVDEQSEVFFYFSGHGAPDVKTGSAYLVPWDGDANFLGTTAYPVQRLYGKLEALKAKHVIVVMDTCFSGAGGRSVLAQGARPLVTAIDTGSVSPGKIIAFTASKGTEISGTVGDQGHGAFTYFFLKGLNGDAADASGHVTARGLYDYLTPKVQDAARRLNRDQTPQLLPDASSSLSGAVIR